MSVGPVPPQMSVDANELVAALQGKIGQYEVEKTASELFMAKQNAYIVNLESQLQHLQAPVPTAD